MEGQQYVQLPPGTTECNHSYYAGNSFSASHFVHQLQNCTITNSVQSLSYTQEANGVASSGLVSSPPLPCSTICPQVPVCPTRHVTGDVMPLADAITQLSYTAASRLLRPSRLSYQSPSRSWMLPCRRLHLVTPFRMRPRRLLFNGSSLSFDVAVQTSLHGIHISSMDAAVQTTPQSTPSQHVSTQIGSRSLQSSQQFHDDPVSTSVHPLVSTQEINDTTPSCSALGPQLLLSHIGSPVLAGPTRNVTGEAMPTSLAEALTQLSFLEFVQRCNFLIAPLQPIQLLVPISPLDVAVQTTSPCEVSQDASTQTSDQPVSSLSLDVAV